MAVQRVAQVLNFLLQVVNRPGLLENVLFVDIAQFYFRHEIRLDLINAEANHQVGNDLIFQFRLANNRNRFINIQQDPLQALEQVQTVFLLLNLIEQAALDAVGAPCSPLLQDLANAHHAGHTGNQDIEITGKGILQGS